MDGLWAGLDEFGMILVRNMNGWLVIYIDMRLVCMIILHWLVRHDFGMVRT